ncbi:MAG: tetratricopeptide repeat protein [Planctomycetota bacterium]|jgi:hypothetical protein
MQTPAKIPGLAAFGWLLGLALAVYLPNLIGAQFINFDDPFFFGAQNDALRQGGLALVLDPRETIANAYLPVSHLSLYLDLLIFGEQPQGPHLHSLLLQVCAAFCLARLLARLGLGLLPATLAASLFLVHPALVESVAWVSGRKDLLSGLFSFLCLSALLRRQTLPMLVFALLALYSKGTALVLPLLAAAMLAMQVRAGSSERGMAWRPLGMLLGLSILVGLHHSGIAADQGTMTSTAASARMGQVPGVFLHYLLTALWPGDLNILYPEVASLEAFRAQFVPGLISLIGCLILVVLLWRPLPLVAGGMACFMLALTPFNTAFPASAIAAADRYLYLAIPGLALALLALPRAGVPLSLLALLLAGVGSYGRSADFRSSEEVWQSSLRQDPQNSVALLNLAAAGLSAAPEDLSRARAFLLRAAKAARYPEHRVNAERRLRDLELIEGNGLAAMNHGQLALESARELPDSPPARALLEDLLLVNARLLRQLGEEDAARDLLAELAAASPNHPRLLAYQASILLAQVSDADGRVPADHPRRAEVEKLLARAEQAAPEDYDLLIARGQWAFASSAWFSADKYFGKAQRVNPGRAEAYLGRGQLLLSQEMAAEAEYVLREGRVAGVRDPQLDFLLALSLAEQGKMAGARRFYEAYLDLRPDDLAARRALASILASETMRLLYQLGPEELAERIARVEALDPQGAKLNLMRAVYARHQRRPQDALAHLALAAETMAGDPELLRLRAESERDRGYELLMTEGRRELAMEHFLAFLQLAGPDMPTEAVRGILREEWRRQLRTAQDALLAEELESAERGFRRCLKLVPEDSSPNLQLGMVLLQGDREAQESALICFEAAERGQIEAGADPSLAVYYRILTLSQLGRTEPAKRLAASYLASPDPAASAEQLERIRAASRALQRKD